MTSFNFIVLYSYLTVTIVKQIVCNKNEIHGVTFTKVKYPYI